LALPTPMVEFPPTIVFPPTWLVIDNGNPSDGAVSEKIVAYITTKFPPVLARRKVIEKGTEPDPFDLLAHGIIVVGGTCANPWLAKWNEKMDPKWMEHDGTFDFKEPIAFPLHIVKKAPEPIDIICEAEKEHSCLISSCMGMLPWLTIFQVAGYHAEDTVTAGELFCAGERRGIWTNKTKVADP